MVGPSARSVRGECSAIDVADEAAGLDDTAILRGTLTELPAFENPAAAPEADATGTVEMRADESAPDATPLWRTALLVCGWLAAAAVLNVVCYVLLTYCRHVVLTGTLAGYSIRPAGLWDWLAVFLPMGAVGIGALCLTIEAWGIGWERSSLRRLLHPRTNSTRTDLFYMFLVISGLKNLLTFLFTLGAGLGAGYWLHAQIQSAFGWNLLENAPFPLALAAVAVVNTFTFYWVHRIMHSRFLWEIHKVHHAAEEMNIITPHRNHPVDHAVVLAMNAFPIALLGASEIVVLTYIALNGIYQELVHTDWDWKLDRWGLGWIEKHVLLSSTAHRIHHSRAARHFDKNFGITPVWDRLFGTYYEPRGERVEVGLENEPEHNTGHPVRELWRVYRNACRAAVRELRGCFRGSRRSASPSAKSPGAKSSNAKRTRAKRSGAKRSDAKRTAARRTDVRRKSEERRA